MTKDEKVKFSAEVSRIEAGFSGAQIFRDGPAKAQALTAMASNQLLALVARILLAKD
ncbi:hypothetical protein KKA53_05335 [Candidatus Dependentiae bacterium]|nr:hypothetical protein [Candidatus Dependentiae bacterium]